jgi:hypothetical protein
VTTYRGHEFHALFLSPVIYLGGGAPFVSTFSGLVTGQRYYARVLALNSQGYSLPAITTPTSEVPRQAPSAPTGVFVYPTTDDSLTVSFFEPLTSGGEDVTLYKIEWDVNPSCNSNAGPPNKGTTVVSAALYNYYTISGLDSTRKYYVRVSAANSMSYGPAERYHLGVTPRTKIPGAPEAVSLLRDGADQLEVTFTPPVVPYFGHPCNGTDTNPGSCPGIIADGGSQITSYLIEISRGNGANGFSELEHEYSLPSEVGAEYATYTYSYKFAPKFENSDYFVRVSALNGVGTSPVSKVAHLNFS